MQNCYTQISIKDETLAAIETMLLLLFILKTSPRGMTVIYGNYVEPRQYSGR